MGVTQASGFLLKWFRDDFCTDEINVAKVLEVDPYARGVFLEIPAKHEKKDMLRAVMEGVSYS